MMLAQPLDLNILPERYRPRSLWLPLLAVVLLLAVLLLGLVPVYNRLAVVQSRTDYLQARLSQAQASLNQVQAERVRVEQQLAEIEQQIEATQAQSARLRGELDLLGQQRTSRTAGIVAAIGALLPRVQIVGLVQEGEALTVSGQAGSQGLVLDYARSLQASGAFANVRILSLVNADPLGLVPDVTFSIKLER